jgi:hypothetical protein
MRFSSIFLLALVLGGLSSCKLFRKTTADDAKTAARKTLVQARAERVAFETMSLTGRVRLESPGGEFSGLSATYRIDLARDSVMLIRLSKFLEVARVRIDRDSIRVVSRLDNTYRVCDFSLAEEYTGLKADFQVLQDLILGNFSPIPQRLVPQNLSAAPQTFTGETAGTNFRYLIDPLIMKLVRIEAQNPSRNLGSVISYDAFETMGDTQMPQFVGIRAASPDTVVVELDHRRVEINPGRVSLELGDTSDYQREGCDF